MKTKQEQIKDLKEAANLLDGAYSLQIKAMRIIIENYEIDDECKYLQNPFFKIRQCNTNEALWKAEKMCYELCMELEKQIKEELNNK